MSTDPCIISFIRLICQHCGVEDSFELIEDFVTYDNGEQLELVRQLLDVVKHEDSEVYSPPFGLAFYKEESTLEKTFKVPIALTGGGGGNAAAVLRKRPVMNVIADNVDAMTNLESTQSTIAPNITSTTSLAAMSFASSAASPDINSINSRTGRYTMVATYDELMAALRAAALIGGRGGRRANDDHERASSFNVSQPGGPMTYQSSYRTSVTGTEDSDEAEDRPAASHYVYIRRVYPQVKLRVKTLPLLPQFLRQLLAEQAELRTRQQPLQNPDEAMLEEVDKKSNRLVNSHVFKHPTTDDGQPRITATIDNPAANGADNPADETKRDSLLMITTQKAGGESDDGSDDDANEERVEFLCIFRSQPHQPVPRVRTRREAVEIMSKALSMASYQGNPLHITYQIIHRIYIQLTAFFGHRVDATNTTEEMTSSDRRQQSLPNHSSSTSQPGAATRVHGPGGERDADFDDDDAYDDEKLENDLGGVGDLARQGSSLDPGDYDAGAGGGEVNESDEFVQRIRDELGVSLFKFRGNLMETIQALQGVFNLTKPEFVSDWDDLEEEMDFETEQQLRTELKQLFKIWDQEIDSVLERLDRPRPIVSGPLEEVDYWRFRSKVLTAIFESLKAKPAKWAIDSWARLCPEAQPFSRDVDVHQLMMESKDNARFLLLVERHFKNVQFGGSFAIVAETIPAMIQSLRLIWTISRGYNKDERMGPLLQRIAFALCDRVVNVLEVRRLFSQPVRVIMRECRSAIRMLNMFERTYLHERQKVEATSQDNRWEFDRKQLFGELRYIRRILIDIVGMARCANEFYRMFGPTLKNITGDSKTLGEVLQLVDQLFTKLKSQDFPCPFLPKNEKAWNRAKNEYDNHVVMIDAKAKNFINDYFAHIRGGATSAFDLLEKFKSVKARPAITGLFKDKYRDVLRSFATELIRVEVNFNELKDTPSLTRYTPPIVGSIAWARSILVRLKTSIMRFVESQPDILEEEEGLAVKARYVNFANNLREYEASRHRSWEAETNSIVSPRLSQPILLKYVQHQVNFEEPIQLVNPPAVWWAGSRYECGTVLSVQMPPPNQASNQAPPPPSISRRRSSYAPGNRMTNSPQGALSRQFSMSSFDRSSGLSGRRAETKKPLLNVPHYEVNFDSKLWGVVRESAGIELLNLSMPQIGRLLTLRTNYYQKTVLQLQRMVDRYEAIRMQLNPLKVNLIESGLRALISVMDRGVIYLNWDSLIIDEFLESCDQKLNKVESNLKEIDRCFDILNQIGVKIAKVNMFEVVKKIGLVSAKEFMDKIENKREHDMEELARSIATMTTSCLSKLEEALFDSSTSRCAEMYPIYQKFEKTMLDNLMEMILKNMWAFINAVNATKPLFFIDVMLINCDLVLYPVSADLYKWMTQTIRGCYESCRYFIRWKHKTCEPCPPIRFENSDDFYTFNYVHEIERCAELREPETAFHQLAQQLNRNVVDVLRRLTHFSRIWHQDKQNIVDKWYKTKYRSTREIELRIIRLQSRRDKLSGMLGPKCMLFIGSISLRLTGFMTSVTSHVRDWVRAYLRYLVESAEASRVNVVGLLKTKRTILFHSPTNLEEMKQVLAVLADIRGGACEEIDSLLLGIAERLRIIKLYADEIPEALWQCERKLKRNWNFIVGTAKKLTDTIAPEKNRYANMIAKEVRAFRHKVQEFVKRYKSAGPGNESEDLERGFVCLMRYIKECDQLDARRVDLLSSERLLDLPISSYPELRELRAELIKLKPIYELHAEYKAVMQEWSLILWRDVKVDDLFDGVKTFLVQFRKQPRKMRLLPAGRLLYEELKNCHETIVLIEFLKNDAMRDRHWKQLMEKTGISFDMDAALFTLEHLFAMKLYQFSEVISVVVNSAQRELLIEKSLDEIKEIWGDMRFQLIQYTKCQREPCFTLGVLDEPTRYMEDHMMILQSIEASRHAIPFLELVRTWEKELTIISDTLDLWITVQQKWMYLEAIFMSPDVAKQMPMDVKRFEVIDRNFRKIMKQTQELQLVSRGCLSDNRLDVLRSLSNDLELCQKALNDYLDAKRNAYPRFYFISDDEVLNILGGKEIDLIQEYVVKMFDNVVKLTFLEQQPGASNDTCIISGMISIEDEHLLFRKPVPVLGKVEEWLTSLESEMKRTVQLNIKQALFYYCHRMSRVDWMFDFQGMIVLAALQIWFTWEVEDLFRIIDQQGKRSCMKSFNVKQHNRLSDIVVQVRGELGPIDRKKLETAIIIDVHGKEIIETFIRDSISTIDDFAWQSQLRFYWLRQTDKQMVSQCTTNFDYGNEFIGLMGRLVLTPLTDRIYLTLTQALSLCLGGSPSGPAGTGKTETIKDLAKALGYLCVITNCAANMDYKSFAKLLSGLCRCGVWGCFDEFNRIEVSVLSVVSSQIKSIQNALQNEAKNLQLDSCEVPLNKQVGIFITMNPGYSSRTELPESLKALFRPVVVNAPDLDTICQVLLFSQGFMTAGEMSRKITTLYQLTKQQLSQQPHYDFGLRALRLLLMLAGNARRLDPQVKEDQLIVRAIRDANVNKLVGYDHQLFTGLVQDLFAGVELEPQVLQPELTSHVTSALKAMHFSVLDEQLLKICQLHDTLVFRHSVMLLGPTGGGKTVLMDVYTKALKLMNFNTKSFIINPKDRSVSELYGTLDQVSREWTDGLLSTLFRQINQAPTTATAATNPAANAPPTDVDSNQLGSSERRFLVFDGDIDALWLEGMNSIMDDNRILTLINGERIRLQPWASLIFEAAGLEHASPGTVSRCGMIYVDPAQLGYTPFWKCWIQGVPTSIRSTLTSLFDKYIPLLLDFIFDGHLPINLSRQMAGGNTTGTEEGGPANTATSNTAIRAPGQTSDGLSLALPLTRLNLIGQMCNLLNFRLGVGLSPGSEISELAVTETNVRAPTLASNESLTMLSLLEAGSSSGASLSHRSHQGAHQQGISSSIHRPPTVTDEGIERKPGVDAAGEEYHLEHHQVLEAVFLHVIGYSFSACLQHASDQAKIDQLIRLISGLPTITDSIDEQGPWADAGNLPTHFPLLTDYFFDLEKFAWLPLTMFVPPYIHDAKLPFNHVFVPTVETVRLSWLIQEFLTFDQPLLVIGPAGTCKTATIESVLYSLGSDSHSCLSMTFSTHTSAHNLRSTLNANVEKRAKCVYGPVPGKKLVVFIDDLNLPKEDAYGTQQPIALLRMLIGRKGMYQQGTDVSWHALRDTTYLAATAPTGAGGRSLDTRFTSLLSIYHARSLSDDSLTAIFGNILSGHFAGAGFSRKLTSHADAFVKLSLAAYKQICETLLPTPYKFHYCFNLRDLSRLFAGLLRSSSERFRGPKKFLRLWRHECMRTFMDRLIEDADRNILKRILYDHMVETFPQEASYALMDPIMFGDYWASASRLDSLLYDDMQDYDVCKAVAEEILDMYRVELGPIDIVLFNTALEHLSAVHRILRLDSGHALLVGVTGSGKRSLARIAAFMARIKSFELPIWRSYNMDDFALDLKRLFMDMAGQPKREFMLLVGEENICEECFLEYINILLTSGFVSTLFTDQERERLLQMVWDEAEASIKAESTGGPIGGVVVTRETVWKYFKDQCATRLHVVLCLDPIGSKLKERFRNFPALTKSTTIDWYFAWPEQALYAVACTVIDPKNPLIPSIYWESIITNVVSMHLTVEYASFEFKRQLRRVTHVTATNYIDFIKGFLTMLDEKTAENLANQRRLNGGLEKLRDTAIQIEQLNVNLAVKKVIIEEKTASCEVLMHEINESTEAATAKKILAEEKTIELEKQSKVIVLEKGEAEEALAEAMPAVEAARAALDELEKNDVTEIRAFATPPKPVQMVGEALCYVLQAPESSWKAARGVMADAGFINTLQTLDVEQIPPKNIAGIKDLIAKRKVSYDDVRAASKAGGGFYKFILAVLTFYDAAREIRPKRERVKALEREYAKAKRDLQKLNDEVANLEATLYSLRQQFHAAQAEMEDLEKEMAIMRRQLLAAEKLTSGLASEKERWINELKFLVEEHTCVLGNSMIMSAFLNYLGPFTAEFRSHLMYNDWLRSITQDDIPISKEFIITQKLANDFEIAHWNSKGLPMDEFSAQNAILTTKSAKSPICIDPQGQASKWIKELEKVTGKDDSRSIKFTTQSDPNFIKTIENVVKFGVPCLIEGVEEVLDPALNDLLRRNIKTDESGHPVVRLGDRDVEFDPSFRLYVITDLANPIFPPQMYGRAVVINYTVTLSGLENQLLSVLVKHEHRELEERRETLVQETNENKRILKELEDRLLLELATQTGNILDNWDLINTLENTKGTAVDVSNQLTQGAVVSRDVERQRDAYRPAARRGAILYFALSDLALVESMYQFSLTAYIVVFVKALKKAMPNSSLPKRLDNIKNALTYATYCYGCTGIFEKHKLLLSFEIAIRLQQDERAIRPKELAFLIHGNLSVGDLSTKPIHEWIPGTVWNDLIYLAAFLPRSFARLPKEVKHNGEVWKNWFEASDPEQLRPPGRYGKKVSMFASLCLIRCWRMDRIPAAVNRYIDKVLGAAYLNPPIASLNDVLAVTGPHQPILLIVQPGSDVQNQLTNLAHAMEFSQSRIKYLSLGQGQEALAQTLFTMSAARGYWLLLQNCHLMMDFLPTIEKMVDDFVKPHPDFRLWLTTEAVPNFPISILRRAYKVVVEPPSGLKTNLIAGLSKLSHEQFVSCDHPNYRACLFTLIFFHSILQERRRYGKLGWNVKYDFAEADFQVSLRILQQSLTQSYTLAHPDKEGSGGQSQAPPPITPYASMLPTKRGGEPSGASVVSKSTSSSASSTGTSTSSTTVGIRSGPECDISWETMKYLIGEVMYGGRAIDAYDRRVLMTYVDEYFGDFLFDAFQPFKFYSNEKVDYFIPEEPDGCSNYKDLYLTYVNNLPGEQAPEVLGLSANASIEYSLALATDLWDNMIRLMPETEVVATLPTTKRLSQVISQSSRGSTKEVDQRERRGSQSSRRKSQASVTRSSSTTQSELTSLLHAMRSTGQRKKQDSEDDDEDIDEDEEDEEESVGEEGSKEKVDNETNEVESGIEEDEGQEDGEAKKKRKKKKKKRSSGRDDTDSGARRKSSTSQTLTATMTVFGIGTSTTSANSPQSSSSGAASALLREQALTRLIEGITGHLPTRFDVIGLRKKQAGRELSPTFALLLQELDRFNFIIDKMTEGLTLLAMALSGRLGMSDELDDIASSLWSAQLPLSWSRLVPPTDKPLPAWILHLCRRAEQYKAWMSSGKSEPPVIWLSGLHMPHSYLTALMQKACRKYEWSLDKCALATTVTEIKPDEANTILMAPELGCHVNGLFIEGSAWDIESNCLVNQKPGQLYQEMPIVKLTPVERHRLKLNGTLPVPLYATKQRCDAVGQGLITSLDLPTKKHTSHSILQGVALLLNID